MRLLIGGGATSCAVLGPCRDCVVMSNPRSRKESGQPSTGGLAAVIGTMNSSQDLSAQILHNPELKQKLLGELVCSWAFRVSTWG